MISQFTTVPNEFFEHIPSLSHAEIRVLLIVIRQTYGWKDFKTGERKVRDKMSYNVLIKKTGLYRTVLTETIKTLTEKNLLLITDSFGNPLFSALERKGKRFLFYQFRPVRISDTTCSQTGIEPVLNCEHNKRNYQKKIKQNTLHTFQEDSQVILNRIKRNMRRGTETQP